MGPKQSENPHTFEENVRKTGKRMPETIRTADRLGEDLDQVKQKIYDRPERRPSWVSISERSSPDEDYNHLQEFVEKTSEAVEKLDRDLETLEQVHDEANTEAYNAMLGLTEGKTAHRALESDERVVDHMRQQALAADDDKVVSETLRESTSRNIDTLEQELLSHQENLASSLDEYADDFENYMQDMAEFAREEYGAMAELTTQLSQLDGLETESDLGEELVDCLQKDVKESLEKQTQNVTDAYNEMIDAHNATLHINEQLTSEVRDRYSQEHVRLENALDRSDQIFENMAGCYDNFAERADKMLKDRLSDIEGLDPSFTENWNNGYSTSPEGEFNRGF